MSSAAIPPNPGFETNRQLKAMQEVMAEADRSRAAEKAEDERRRKKAERRLIPWQVIAALGVFVGPVLPNAYRWIGHLI